MTLNKGWTAAEAAADTSWIHRLSPEAVAGFDQALEHAKSLDKDLVLMTQDDFPLPPASVEALKSALDCTQGPWGMCQLKGFPVDRWTESDCRIAYWGLGLYLGVARTQNKASDILNDVRDAGGSYKVTNGRGYNTNAELDFHCDSCDVVALLCRRTAKEGGASKIVSSKALVAEFARRRPDLVDTLRSDFYYSYQGAQDASQPPYYIIPLLGSADAPFAFRINRKNVTAAQRDFPEIPRLTQQQVEALDLIDELLADPNLLFTMWFEKGDLQLLNNYTVVHSRTSFVDYEEHDKKRHLIRLWMSVPNSQELPRDWANYYGDYRAGSVRGGLRGSARTKEFDEFEVRQAARMKMLYKPFEVPAVRQQEPQVA